MSFSINGNQAPRTQQSSKQQSAKNSSVEALLKSVPPTGTQNPKILSNAPSPSVKICGETKQARIVVDLSHNILYTYNNGKPECAYLIASGAASSPTSPGVRVVTHVETYPYKSAPKQSQRRRTPRAFGPKIVCLEIVNPKTGETTPTGEFIHGNNNASSIGKYASHGCMRMDNTIIKQIAQIVNRGDIVLILPNNK